MAAVAPAVVGVIDCPLQRLSRDLILLVFLAFMISTCITVEETVAARTKTLLNG